MTVGYASSAESDRAGSGGDPYAFNFTPAGTPRGIVVVIIQHTQGGTDAVAGVTYGGVSLARLQRNSDVSGEVGAAYLYFLGASIPTSTQSVSMDLTSNSTANFNVYVVELSAGADTEAVDDDGVSDNVANPSVVLSYTGRTCIAVGGLFSGRNVQSDIALLSGMSNVQTSADSGTIGRCDRQTTPGASDFTYGYTVVTDDVAMVAGCFAEVAGGGAVSRARGIPALIGA